MLRFEIIKKEKSWKSDIFQFVERETAVKVGWMGGIEKKLNNNQIRH